MNIDNKNLTIRKGNISDLNTLIDYRMLFLQEVQGHNPPQVEIRLRESLRKYLTKSILDESFISWIAEVDGNPVGFSGME